MDSNKDLPTGTVFGDMDKYWAELVDADATEKQLVLVQNIFSAKNELLLDLGCGTGRHTVKLCSAGYNVIGIDFSKNLLQIAKKKAANTCVSCEFINADIRFIPFRPGIFDGIISLDTSFGYLPSEKEDLQSLKDVKRVLSENGFLLLDVFNRERMIQRYGKNNSFQLQFKLWSFLLHCLSRFPKWGTLTARFFQWHEYPNFFLLQKRLVNNKTGELRDLWVIRSKQSKKMNVFIHAVRLYELVQLRNLFEKVNLKTKKVYGNYEAENFTEASKRLIVIAK